MPTLASTETIDIAALTQAVNDVRDVSLRRYPAALTTLITTQRAIVIANQPIATGGTVQAAIDAQNMAVTALQKINAHVRFYFCCVSDELNQTTELTSNGRQARRTSGQPPFQVRSDRSPSAPQPSPCPLPTSPKTPRTCSPTAKPTEANPNSRASPPHRLSQPIQHPQPRRHLRILARRTQLPRRRPGKRPCHTCRNVILIERHIVPLAADLSRKYFGVTAKHPVNRTRLLVPKQ